MWLPRACWSKTNSTSLFYKFFSITFIQVLRKFPNRMLQFRAKLTLSLPLSKHTISVINNVAIFAEIAQVMNKKSSFFQQGLWCLVSTEIWGQYLPRLQRKLSLKLGKWGKWPPAEFWHLHDMLESFHMDAVFHCVSLCFTVFSRVSLCFSNTLLYFLLSFCRI